MTLRLSVFFCLVALGVAAALQLVSERAAIMRAGRRVAELEHSRRSLVEKNRKLEAELARLKSPARLVERIKALGIQIVPPEEEVERGPRRRAAVRGRRSGR